MMTDQEVENIIHNWSSGQDVWQGDESWMGEKWDDALVYPPAALTKKPGRNYRELPEHFADEARRYIQHLCSRYPLQLQIMLALPMWLRFCEAWNELGDRKIAMRVI
jgi:hypothetical protein